LGEPIIKEGSDVLLFLDRRRSYLIKAEKGGKLHTHKGFIQIDDVIGERFGGRVLSSLGFEFIILKPTIYDYLRKASRSTQIVYPKDIALIVAYSRIGPGSRVVEAGTGSGALTGAIAHYIRPSGKVYSYEVREEFMEKARKNLRRFGVLDYVELKNGDVTLGISEVEVDAVILDLATPWLVVPNAYEALKGSGCIVSFSPTIDQVVKTVKALKENGFIGIETMECILRRMKAVEGKTRPETLMRGHTGYITHARKGFKRKNRFEK
jgi:tRNA (adenine57-N1/adenine58-N1)-methyltransferase